MTFFARPCSTWSHGLELEGPENQPEGPSWKGFCALGVNATHQIDQEMLIISLRPELSFSPFPGIWPCARTATSTRPAYCISLKLTLGCVGGNKFWVPRLCDPYSSTLYRVLESRRGSLRWWEALLRPKILAGFQYHSILS